MAIENIKVIFNRFTGDVKVDAHKICGSGHVEGSAKFTEDLGKKLGKIDERHKGHDVHTKDVQHLSLKLKK